MDIWAYHLHENENHPNKKWFVRSRSLLTLEFVKKYDILIFNVLSNINFCIVYKTNLLIFKNEQNIMFNKIHL